MIVFTEEALESDIFTGGVKHPCEQEERLKAHSECVSSLHCYCALVKVHSLLGLSIVHTTEKKIFFYQMVYTAWLCCIVLSILENLCRCLNFCMSASVVLIAFCVRKEREREREKYLLKGLRPRKQSPCFHLSMSRRSSLSVIFLHRPRLPLTCHSGRSQFVPVFFFHGLE